MTSDMTTVKACLTDPTASGCTGTYSGTSSMPGITASVSTLSTDVTALKGCMTDPTASACTGTYSAATTLNKLVESMSKCMTNPTATDCTSTYSASTTLPMVTYFTLHNLSHKKPCNKYVIFFRDDAAALPP